MASFCILAEQPPIYKKLLKLLTAPCDLQEVHRVNVFGGSWTDRLLLLLGEVNYRCAVTVFSVMSVMAGYALLAFVADANASAYHTHTHTHTLSLSQNKNIYIAYTLIHSHA